MANLIITNACNLSCPFCFASEYLADGDGVPAERMSLEEVAEHLEFIGEGPVRFCGGEPTTHPDFTRMLDLALEHPRRQVFMMTNAVWPASVREHVRRLSTADRVRLRYLVNILEPALYTDAQWSQLVETLAVMHPLAVTLGITLYRAPMSYAHVLELAECNGIQRIRFSVASPNTTDPRSWNLEPQRDFPILAPLVHALVMDARSRGLLVHSDCGYIPPCFFTAQQIRDLRDATGHPPAVEFRCEGPVDLGPGGEAWRCYGLFSSLRARTHEFENAAELGDYFERQTALFHDRFMFDACRDCDWRARGECAGGCYAYRATRDMKRRAASGLVQIGEDRRVMDAVPSINEQNLHGRLGTWMVREQDTWVPLHTSAVEAHVLRACDGARTVRDVVTELERNGVLRQGVPAVTRAVRKLFEQGAITLSPA
ncbi:MAG: radical SAM protein [Myxococcota bacterium]